MHEPGRTAAGRAQGHRAPRRDAAEDRTRSSTSASASPRASSAVADEEGILDVITLTVEAGAIGGVPAGGLSFGAAANPQAIIDQPYQFDFYDGGGLDQAFLGMAAGRPAGQRERQPVRPGGSPAPAASSTSARPPEAWSSSARSPRGADLDGRRRRACAIRREGAVPQVRRRGRARHLQRRTSARATGQSVLYVTERCVFRLAAGGLELIEIAPGIDLERDLLTKMSFRPKIAADLREMDPAIFSRTPLGLAQRSPLTLEAPSRALRGRRARRSASLTSS